MAPTDKKSNKYTCISQQKHRQVKNDYYAKTINNQSIFINQQILTPHIFHAVSNTETLTHNIANKKH